MNRILRIFPRRTNATPDDELTWIGDPGLFIPEVDEVHVSVTFTYDRAEGKRLKAAWSEFHPTVKIGGPGMGERGENFTPGLYLKPGYVITSRGCPNKCWFCDVWKREGDIRELSVTEGWNVLDDNLLACSKNHIEKVFKMLKGQPHRTRFTGGLDSRLLTAEIADMLQDLNPESIFLAYDTPDDWEPLVEVSQLLVARELGYKKRCGRVYVLIGYPGDTINEAQKRLEGVWDLGLMPFAMLYRDHKGETELKWRDFTRSWIRPHAIISTMEHGRGSNHKA